MPSRDDVRRDSNEVLVTGIVFGLIAGIAVLVRFLIKIRNPTGRFGWDDWWILAACILFYIEDGLQIASYKAVQAPDFSVAHWFKLQYVATQLYTTTACFIKLSLLCLYRRLFDTQSFRLASLIVMIPCVLWAVGCGFAEVFVCNPPHHFWDPDSTGYCYPREVSLVSILAIELVIDTIILILPIRMVWALQMSRTNKVSISLIFLLGSFAVITNVIHIALSHNDQTSRETLWLNQLWLNIHFGTAILCACLPVYGPILQRIVIFISKFRPQYIISSRSQASSGGGGGAQSGRSKTPAGGKHQSSQYAKMNDYTLENLRLADRHSDPSLADENVIFETAGLGKTRDMV